MSRKVLVTGSSGQIGSYMVDMLKEAGDDVIGLDLVPDPRTQVSGNIVEVGPSDLGDLDAIVHCAAQVDVRTSIADPAGDATANILGTLNLLCIAREKGAHMVYISSAAVYGEPVGTPISEDHPTRPSSPYGLSKLVGERYCELYRDLHGVKVDIVRPFNVFSQRQKVGVIKAFQERLDAGETLTITGDGSQVRDFIHARDIVALTQRILEEGRGDSVYNGCTGSGTSIIELARMMLAHWGRSDDVVTGPPVKGDIAVSIGDPARAKAIGMTPSVTLKDHIGSMEVRR